MNLCYVDEEKHDPERLSGLPCVTQCNVAQPEISMLSIGDVTSRTSLHSVVGIAKCDP